MKIKTRMIGMDLDGTLLKSDKELPQYTKDVLKRAIEQGIIVMPATGRPITGVPKELLEFPGIRYAVTANGGRVIDLEKNEAIVEELLPHDIAEVMMDVFEHYDTFREIYFDGVGYASREALEHIGKYLSVPAMANYIMSTRVAVDDVRVKFDETKLPVDKIQALFTSVEDRDAARKEIEDVPGIEITGALPMNLEINAAGVNKGIIVMPATGRPITGVPKELLEFPGIRYAVTANGGRVIDLEKNEAIVEELLPHDIAEVMMDVFEHYDTFREIYFDGVGYASREALEHIGKYLSVPAMANYIMSTRVAVDDVRVKFDETKLPVDKIQALFTSVEDRDAARKEIEDVPGIEITGALPMNLEINAAGVNKGKAMIELGKLLGIPREEIMAFGDGNNDLKMLKEVGMGVAMENAIPSVKEAADYVALSNDEEGVAKFIEKYVLD